MKVDTGGYDSYSWGYDIKDPFILLKDPFILLAHNAGPTPTIAIVGTKPWVFLNGMLRLL